MRIFNDIKDALMAKKIPYNKFDKIIEDVLYEHQQSHNRNIWYFKAENAVIYKEVKQWNDEKKVDFITHCIQKMHIFLYEQRHLRKHVNQEHCQIMRQFIFKLVGDKLMISDESLEQMVKAIFEDEKFEEYSLQSIPIPALVNQVKKQYGKDAVLSDLMVETLNKFKEYLEKHYHNNNGKENLKLIEKIGDTLFRADEINQGIKPSIFSGKDGFSSYANNIINTFPIEQRQIWYQLIEKAKKVKGSKPSKKYLTETKNLIKELGTNHFKKMVNDWFIFIAKMELTQQPHTSVYGYDAHTYNTTVFIGDLNNETIKGLVWMCAHFHDAETLQNITALAERCHKKIRDIGTPSAIVGNACFYTLYKSKGLDGISKLSTLKTKIKRKQALKLIDKYLIQAAKDKGISIHEIQDLSIDDYGLNEGKRTYTFDDYSATISITKPGKSTLTWLKPDGKTQKSIPAFVKTKHANKLKKMKNTKKQIDQTTSAQRNRIDRMFKADRTWNVEHFEKLFLRHGLMCTLTKKLIWTFTYNDKSQSAIYLNDQWVNYKKQPVTLHPKATIRLWHPALCSLDEVQGWRSFLMENEIQQALKQAFREIYLLTEAEINTGTYSNRMAAHILKQHQYLSLVKARNWSATITGNWDSGDGTAHLDIPEYGLRAEFWAEGVRDDNQAIWDYLSTDQIRFINTETEGVVELINIPPIVFSEVLRDVDLFVGVASVGNDPMWQDSGGRPGFRDYWHSYSFGDLSVIAKNRKEILEGLVPRLKIKDVAEIKDKFLVVKGKLRTYKIHIGSGNILMEPNDQYLCIVPDRSKKDVTQNLFIPFEGDKTLSVILSKAFLLANDDTITDSTITSQIKRK